MDENNSDNVGTVDERRRGLGERGMPITERDERAALRAAACALIDLAPLPVLRATLRLLANEQEPPSTVASPRTSALDPIGLCPADGNDWKTLRLRLWKVVTRDGISLSALAKLTHLHRATLKRVLTPGARPQRRIRQALSAWLTEREKSPLARDRKVPGPKPRINGAARPAPSLRAGNGTNRLSEDEGERLSRYLARADDRAIRCALGMTSELAAAIAARRDDLAAEAVDRARTFLAAS